MVAVSPLVMLPLLAFLPWELNVMVLAGMVVGLLVGPIILWAIVPRKSTPDLDGVAVDPAREGALFRFLRSVAKRTKQSMPSLLMINTAAHASTGFYAGFAGFSSQRVLSVGLPYFGVMSVNELSALLAHELGHFYRGSMFRWAWIVETQQAIGRFFQLLERHWPRLIPVFGWVLTPFVKACLEVSREQELAADRFAAEHFGADTLRQAIAKTRQLEVDYSLYFQSEVLPVIHAGYATPLLEGFAQFREGLRQGVEPRFRLAVKTDAQPAATNLPAMSPEFQTHPDFETRLEAIRNDGWSNRMPDARPAVALLEDLPALELRLLSGEAQKRGLGSLKPLPWSEVGERVYLTQWQEFSRRHGDLLEGAAMRDLPVLVRRAEELGRRLGADGEQALQYLSAAACTALAQDGWELSYAQAGAPRAFTKNGQQVDMFAVIEKLAWEEMASFEWEDQAEALGIAGVSLDATSASHAG